MTTRDSNGDIRLWIEPQVERCPSGALRWVEGDAESDAPAGR